MKRGGLWLGSAPLSLVYVVALWVLLLNGFHRPEKYFPQTFSLSVEQTCRLSDVPGPFYKGFGLGNTLNAHTMSNFISFGGLKRCLLCPF